MTSFMHAKQQARYEVAHYSLLHPAPLFPGTLLAVKPRPPFSWYTTRRYTLPPFFPGVLLAVKPHPPFFWK